MKEKFVSIAASRPFFQTFVEHFFQRYAQENDSLWLSRTQIYVPTKRAARQLREIFAAYNQEKSQFLPRIYAFYDIKDLEEAFHEFGRIQPRRSKISHFDKIFILAKLVRFWHQTLSEKSRVLFGPEGVLLPNSLAEAIHFAHQLAGLMEEVTKSNSQFDQLEALLEGHDLAQWWQITQKFLHILFQNWPQILAEKNLTTEALLFKEMVTEQIQFWQEKPLETPIVTLGLQGPAAFLKTVLSLPKGCVYLQGVDFLLDEEAWQALDASYNTSPTLFTHPQYSYHYLLKNLAIGREDITNLASCCSFSEARERMLSTALRPAETTHQWICEDRDYLSLALNGLCLIEASNHYEEALAIAVVMRETLLDAQKKVALVTSDRSLARRVALELRRFHIIANESVGQPLKESAPLVFIRLLLDCVIKPYDPVTLLAFFKHPLTKIGHERARLRRLVESFEYHVLRAEKPPHICYKEAPLASFSSYLEEVLSSQEDSKITIEEEEKAALLNLGEALKNALSPLLEEIKKQEVSLRDLFLASFVVADRCASNQEGSPTNLYAGAAGEALLSFRQAMLETIEDINIHPNEWPEIFDSLLEGFDLTPLPYGHKRVFIWGPLEAQLQTVDRVILAGLNEDSMPSAVKHDPFLSRPMKEVLNLLSPEHHLGLEAHDFQMLMGMKEVFFTRSLQVDNSPAVPSRWLQRIEAVLGEDNFQKLKATGQKYIALAKRFDKGKSTAFADRPDPKPPLKSRPKLFYVTEIELLLNNPYAIYAKKILNLRPLAGLLQDQSALTRGQLFHHILEEFKQRLNQDPDQNRASLLRELQEKQFSRFCLPMDVYALWWKYFEANIEGYLAFEEKRARYKSYVEISSKKISVEKTGIDLMGRADRIDLLEGGAEILDLKTGKMPTISEAASLRRPQLALEGALLLKGAFNFDSDVKNVPLLKDLYYIRFLAEGFDYQSILKAQQNTKTACELAEEAWARLNALLVSYGHIKKGYAAYALKPKFSFFGTYSPRFDYNHLARTFEWGQLDDGEP